MNMPGRYPLTSRMLIIAIGMSTIFALVLMRLAHLQLLKGMEYAQLAQDNRLFTLPVSQSRGIIFDRYGLPLVLNVPDYFVITSDQALYTPITHISPEEATQRIVTGDGVVSFAFQRKYTFPQALAHVIGYIGPASVEDIKKHSLSPTDVIGKMGLERVFDATLRGTPGTQVIEVNALGKKSRLVSYQDGMPGQPVVTTLDPILSLVIQELMGTNKGAVVVLDPATGHVLGLVSTPGFDADVFTAQRHDLILEKTRLKQVQDILTDERKVLFNRAVHGAYPPGSVFKVVSALAGLDSGAITAQTTVRDEGILRVGEYSYANWFYRARGGVDGDIAVQRAIARSNDIYFYKSAEWTGPTTIANMARLFGFGVPTGIELPGEQPGLVPDPAWKEEIMGERWFLGNTYHFGIGQGDLLVTPLQVAQMTQIVSEHGVHCAPTLQGTKAPSCQEIGVQEEHLNVVLAGLLDACSPGGTAGLFFERNTAVRAKLYGEQYTSDKTRNAPQREVDAGAVACKTGTAEFGPSNERGQRKTHAWFIAIATLNMSEQNQPPIEEEANLLQTIQLDVAEQPLASLSGVVQDTQSAEWSATQHQQRLQTLLQQEPLDMAELHRLWKSQVQTHDFPERLVFTVLVESDETKLYREGSVDAAGVVARLLSWIETGK